MYNIFQDPEGHWCFEIEGKSNNTRPIALSGAMLQQAYVIY
jgi:hypothetical protein